MGVKPCLTCGAITPGSRCPACTKAMYGPDHRRERAWWAPRVEAGVVVCPRCRDWIKAGEAWELGHQPGLASHPEHWMCNRRKAGMWRR